MRLTKVRDIMVLKPSRKRVGGSGKTEKKGLSLLEFLFLI